MNRKTLIENLIKTGVWLEQGKLDKEGAVADIEYLLEKHKEQLRINVVMQPEAEKFACYEIHTVQARMFGCKKQCNECKAEELSKL